MREGADITGLFLVLAAQAAPAAAAPAATFDLARAEPALSSLTVLPRCGTRNDTTEVIVCGNRNRYRLPLPLEREPGGTARDLPGGTAALTPTGPCGIFAGERRCRNADKAEFGYGRGRDPVTLLSRLAKKVADPDAD